MAYVQVKNLLQTWKLAAFTVAFFSSFFSVSYAVDYSSLDFGSPKMKEVKIIISSNVSQDLLGTEHTGTATEYCNMSGLGGYASVTAINVNEQQLFMSFDCDWVAVSGGHYPSTGGVAFRIELVQDCPPEGSESNPVLAQYNTLINGEGAEIDKCFNNEDLDVLLRDSEDLIKEDDYCKELVVDAGNNTTADLCYSANNGSSCSVTHVSAGGMEYYKGTGRADGGCGVSDDSPFDQQGVGNEDDKCVFSGGVNYCAANKDKHCPIVNGTETCDSGCAVVDGNAFCDASKHPDVGEGESDYFNSNGTCSAISASSSKGFCEEMGGTWDDTGGDFQETSCPVGSGSCSTGSTICGACIDEGGVWTPDANAQTDVNAINDVSQRVKDSNTKLSAIENTTRKSGEAITSTIKSGNGKIVAAIDSLAKANKASSAAILKEKEKEKFTTTTDSIDKTKITSLFDDASKTALQADITQLKLDTTAFINSAKAEAQSLMNVTVPNSTGYEARNLTLTHGTFDMSLNRFNYFFQLLAGPVMLLCSVFAGFILLGGKD